MAQKSYLQKTLIHNETLARLIGPRCIVLPRVDAPSSCCLTTAFSWVVMACSLKVVFIGGVHAMVSQVSRTPTASFHALA